LGHTASFQKHSPRSVNNFLRYFAHSILQVFYVNALHKFTFDIDIDTDKQTDKNTDTQTAMKT